MAAVGAHPHPAFPELLDQHQATSHLLNHREVDETSTTHVTCTECLKVYDVEDVRASGGDKVQSDKIESKTKTLKPKLRKGLRIYAVTWELANVMIASCFLALGICVVQLQDEPSSRWSSRIVQATRIAPSIWPILFSGVLATAIRAFADWQAEKGVSLLALEQLLGSLTMASSVVTMFRWSIVRFTSALLILLWAFNPLGSQAVLRSAYLQPNSGISSGLIDYYDNNYTASYMLSIFSRSNPESRGLGIVSSLYGAVLHDYASSLQYTDLTDSVASGRIADLGGSSTVAIQTATDNFGNIRIPHVRYLPGYAPDTRHEWFSTRWDQEILNYSSLVGDRIAGVNRAFTGNTTFTIPSSYQEFSCSPWIYLNGTSSKNATEPNDSEANDWLWENTLKNFTSLLGRDGGTCSVESRSIFMARTVYSQLNSSTLFTGPEIVFGQYRSDLLPVSLTRCTTQTTYVEANVTCVSKGTLSKTICGVNAIRESPEPPGETDFTIFTTPLATNGLDYFADLLQDGYSLSENGPSSSNAEYYLANPLSGGWPDPANWDMADLGNLDTAVFERRFALLVNTLWKSSWLKQGAVGRDMISITNDAPTGMQPSIVMNTTSTVMFPLPETYTISRAWITVYFIAVAVMLLAAVLALVVRSLCAAPSVIGYIGSLTRDSVYFRAMDRSTLESGAETTKRLGEMRVMVADVGSERDGVGRVAFAPVGTGERIRKGRVYF